MKFTKPHFFLHKTQRNALLILMILLMGFIFFSHYFLVFVSPTSSLEETVMEYYQKKIESLDRHKSTAATLYPFNPNGLTDQKAYLLGMDEVAVDRLLAYRSGGKWFNSAAQFQSITGVNDDFMSLVGPYMLFSERRLKQNKRQKPMVKLDLNQSIAHDLTRVYGIGEKLSERIIKYRNFLQAFSHMDQLYEVYGLDSSVVQSIGKYFEIKHPPQFKKLLLDTVSYGDLLRLPYVEKADARKIIGLRTSKGSLKMDDLKSIEGFDSLKIARISVYLKSF